MPAQPSVAAPVQSTKRSTGNDPPATQWGRSGEPGSAFSGLGKPNRGKSGGRGRGGRRGGGNSTAHGGVNASPHIQKSDSMSGNSQITSPPSPATIKTEKSSSSSLKTPNRQPSAQTDSLSTRPASSNEPHGSKKPYSRRRRSNTSKNPVPQQSRHVLGAEYRSRKDQTEELETKDASQPSMASTPNSQNTSLDIKSNIDALVERVRANAMANHRPGTPGSHIDWAGDDDNSLPDLNDWGIKSLAPTGHAMISPIIVDGLTPLPELVSLTQSQVDTVVNTSTKAPESIGSHRVQMMTEEKKNTSSSVAYGKPDGVTHPSSVERVSTDLLTRSPLHPSLPPKPASFVQCNGRHCDRSRSNASRKQMRSPVKTTIEMTDTECNNSLISPGVRAPERCQSQARSQENSGDETGLSASIHAPGQQETSRLDNAKSVPSTSNPAPQVHSLVHNKARSITHSRAHTVGHSSSFHRIHTTSSSTGPQSADHARTQSSPVLTKNNGRSFHSRPVLTGDAISRLARTIGGATAPTPKQPPLSASTE